MNLSAAQSIYRALPKQKSITRLGGSAQFTRLLSYLVALGIGVGIVLTLFPRDMIFSGVIADARLTGDPALHTIGQRAFLMDSWHWPLLRTTLLGAPLGINIAMTDSNPFAALPLKLFRGLLPAGFSAIGLWLVLDYVLQPLAAVFALRSAGEKRLIPGIAGALLAISMPTFLFRFVHSALSSHFILLFALGAYFRVTRGERGRVVLPILLLPVSFLIHPYLAFMTAAILFAAPVTLVMRADKRWASATAIFAVGLAVTAAVTLCLGYVAANPTGGFGLASMNVISPLYPTYSYYLGRYFPMVDATGFQYEGYQFLGLGVIGLLAVCIVAGWFSIKTDYLGRHLGIFLACLALAALAISNVVYVGFHKVADLGHVPDFMHQLRGSGRLFWPATYVLMVGSVATVSRLVPAPFASALLMCAALLQMVDAHDLNKTIWRGLRRSSELPIDAKRLDSLLDVSTFVTILPTQDCGANAADPTYLQLLLGTSRKGVPVNTMFVARVAAPQVCDVSPQAMRPLDPGELRVFLPAIAAAGPAIVPDAARFCRTLDTVSVCTRTTALLNDLPRATPATVPIGREILMGSTKDAGLLGTGWYMPEPEGVWTVEHQAFIAAKFAPPSGAIILTMTGTGFTGVHGTPQHVTLSINGYPAGEWLLPDREVGTFRARIPKDHLGSGTMVVRFDVANPTRPSTVGVNTDTRALGLFLESIRVDSAE